MTLRVGVVIATEHVAGGEKYLLRLYQGLDEIGRARGHLLGRLDGWAESGLPVTDIGMGAKWSFKRLLRSVGSAPAEYRRALGTIRALHREDPFDVFHLQYKREQILLTRALSKLAPVVWTEHGALPSGVKGSLLARLYRRASRSVSHVIAVTTTETANVVASALSESTPFSRLPMAVDTRRFRPPRDEPERLETRARLGLPQSGLLAVVVSRLHPLKGVDRAVCAVPDDGGVHLVIAGTGPATDDLRAMAKGRAVEFIGWVDDPSSLYRACDIVLLPFTRVEGYPTSLVEAAASGCALVGFAGDLMNDEVVAAGGVILGSGEDLADIDWSDLAERRVHALAWAESHRLGPWLEAHAETLEAVTSSGVVEP